MIESPYLVTVQTTVKLGYAAGSKSISNFYGQNFSGFQVASGSRLCCFAVDVVLLALSGGGL